MPSSVTTKPITPSIACALRCVGDSFLFFRFHPALLDKPDQVVRVYVVPLADPVVCNLLLFQKSVHIRLRAVEDLSYLPDRQIVWV